MKSSFLDDESEDSDDSDDGSDTDVESIDNASSDASETSQESENDEEITCEDSTVAAQKEVEETKLESSGYDSEHDKVLLVITQIRSRRSTCVDGILLFCLIIFQKGLGSVRFQGGICPEISP